MKFGFDCQADLEKKIFETGGHIHAAGRGRQSLGVNFLSLTYLFSQFSH